MARPWFEAAPALAAGVPDHVIPIGRPAHPLARILRMSGLPDYAFARRLDGRQKPTVFSSLNGLANYVERHRFGQALELVEIDTIEIPGRPGLYCGVQIFTLLLDGGRDLCLGYAWMNGYGRDRLEPALRQTRRDVGRKLAA